MLANLVNKKSDGSLLSQFDYSYNSDGLRSQLSETLGSQTATVSYTYDALHRLKDEVRTGADAYENHYTYDAAGNRLTWHWGTGSTTYTYDAADRLTQAGNTTYTYNANGSRITKTTSGSVTSYSYDYDEQLTQVASPVTGTSSFTYDELGRRVTRTSGETTTTFYFDGDDITTETQGSIVVAHYVYGINRISRDASGSYEYYHADGLGSTRQLSNDSQSVVQTTTYDAFGNIESSAGSSSNAYKYAGQFGYRNDGDDGLMHVGARYYDPLVGRFLQADTWLGMIARPQSLNRYVYTENNPVNAVDPSGKVPWLLIVAIVVLIVSTPEHPDHPGSIMIDPEPGIFYGSLLLEIGAWCFVAGTLIHTREGLKPIEEIQAGEWILSKDEQTGEVSYQRVARTFKHTTPQIVTVRAGKEKIHTTPEHPFYVQGKGWVRAGSLEVGDRLLTPDNAPLIIRTVTVEVVRGRRW